VHGTVAAACAMIAGWILVVGQVTAVPIGRLVTWESAPIMPQTKLDCPCSSSHGRKWSEIHRASKPACSASLACWIRLAGSYSSQDRKYPYRVMRAPLPWVCPRSHHRTF
jgi:hypothetical protein